MRLTESIRVLDDAQEDGVSRRICTLEQGDESAEQRLPPEHTIARLAGDLGERVIEGNVLATLDRNGRRAERFRATPDLPSAFRSPYGPGWALVGDAGLVMDPLTAQGIGHALLGADALAGAIADGLEGRRSFEAALADYRRGDHEVLPIYEFTVQLASLSRLRAEERMLFTSLATKPAEIERFLGRLTGTVPVREYMTPANLVRLIGARGMARVVASKLRRPRTGAGGTLPRSA